MKNAVCAGGKNVQIVYATTNNGKFLSMQSGLAPYQIEVVQETLTLPEYQDETVERIAIQKVRFAYETLKRSVVSLDAGLFIPVLKNWPGPNLKFELGTLGLDGILRLLAGREDRQCHFRDALAYMDASLAEPRCFTRDIPGSLSLAQRGTPQPQHWSKIALVFIPEGDSRTLAEMSPEEYKVWKHSSHDKAPLYQPFAEWLIQHWTSSRPKEAVEWV